MRHSGGRLIPDRNFWFDKIGRIYVLTRKAALPCQKACPELLCESRDAEQVLFLPYELEFIQKEIGQQPARFETVLLDGVAYGYMSGSRDCPVYKSPDCLIHELRPFDCRSFPILPAFHTDGSVTCSLAPYCPLSKGLDPDFVTLITSLWSELAPHLPEAWKAHYNFLYSPATLIPISS